jgi:hypothetical protein
MALPTLLRRAGRKRQVFRAGRPAPGTGVARRNQNGTTREYIWLPETEIALTRADASGHPKRHQEASKAQIDRPLAVVSAVNTATPATWWVSVDLTTSTKASVWDAVWQPWGGIHGITGSASLDARFPGQWFQCPRLPAGSTKESRKAPLE